MNHSNLNSYVQEPQVDIFSLWKDSKITIEALKRCRNNDNFKNFWDLLTATSNNVKQSVQKNYFFEFQYPKLPRHWQVPVKIQASFGENDTEKHDFQEVFDHYREVFFVLLDLAINESEARWLFCAYLLMLLWILILHKQESLLGVGEHFKIDFNPLVPDVH